MKSGKYFIGASYPLPREEIIEPVYRAQESKDRHLTLIHNDLGRFDFAFIGADTIGETASGIEPPLQDPLPNACNFHASLERVVCAQVFSDRETERCRGILLEYEDGIKRALGQCRLGFDPVRCYEYPTRLCYLPGIYRLKRGHTREPRVVHVAFDPESDLLVRHDTGKWEICPMKGTLHFAFSCLETVLKIHDA